MSHQSFDYEDVFMGVRDKKPKTYRLSFAQDYRLRSLVESIHLGSGRLLDIGCGGGRISETLPYYYKKGRIYGCDVSATAITYAKKMGSGRVTYKVSKTKKLPYSDNFFDVCICLDVLEHVPDVNFFLKEVRRVLKKGGVFFLIVPTEGEPGTFTWVFQKLGIGDHITFRFFGHIHPEFTHRYVEQLLIKHKFIIEEKKYSEHVFYQLAHLCIFYAPKLLMEVLLGRKKASEYTNSSLIRTPKKGFDLLVLIRNAWFVFFDFMMERVMPIETRIFKHIPLTAWKLHVRARR